MHYINGVKCQQSTVDAASTNTAASVSNNNSSVKTSGTNDKDTATNNQKIQAQGTKANNKRTRKRKNNNSKGTNQHKSAKLSPPTSHRTTRHENDFSYLNKELSSHINQQQQSDLLFKSSNAIVSDMQASNIIIKPTNSLYNDQQSNCPTNSEIKDQIDTNHIFNQLIEAVTSNSDQFSIDEMTENKITTNESASQPPILLGNSKEEEEDRKETNHETIQQFDTCAKLDKSNVEHEPQITSQSDDKDINLSTPQIFADQGANIYNDSIHLNKTDHNLIDCDRDIQTEEITTENSSEESSNQSIKVSQFDIDTNSVLEESLPKEERLTDCVTPEPTSIDKDWLSASIIDRERPDTSFNSKESLEPEPLEKISANQENIDIKDGNETRETSPDLPTAPISEESDIITIDNRPMNEVLSSKPLDLPETVIRLETKEGSPVYLIGTSHFSKKSIQDVVHVMQMIRPSAVVLELCREREMMLRLDEEQLLSECGSEFNLANFRSASKRSGAVQGTIFILFLRLSAILTKKLGMAPGGEFRAAARQSREIPGCRLYFGDRSLKVTIARAVNSLSFWQKIKFVYIALTADMSGMTQDELENFKNKDVLEELLKELQDDFPAFKRVLLDERNTYLAHNIYSTASTQCTQRATVAVVGIGHLQGIVDNWGKTNELEIQSLEIVPEKSRTRILIGMGIKYTLWGAVAYTGYRLICPNQIQSQVSFSLWKVFSQVTKLRYSSAQ